MQLFVERQPDGGYDRLRGDAKHHLGHFSTQEKAIKAGKKKEPDHAVLIERVRNTTRGKRDKWRRA